MSREILFRAQHIKTGEKVNLKGEPVLGIWVYGGILQGPGNYSIIYSVEPEISKWPVYSDTIGQFTGETETLCDDKDNLKSGSKIFDGDILEIYSSEWEGTALYLIYWDEESLGWHRKHLRGPRIVDDEIDSIKIAGNRWDNPELLEVTS